MNKSAVSPASQRPGLAAPRHSSWMSTDSPSSRVNVAATPDSSIFSGTVVRSTQCPAGDSNTAPTPATTSTVCGARP